MRPASDMHMAVTGHLRAISATAASNLRDGLLVAFPFARASAAAAAAYLSVGMHEV